MHDIVMLYYTLLTSIVAGIVNSIFCKKDIFKRINTPIDNNKVLKDGKRLFGANKTWKGFVGYIIFNIIFSILFGLLTKVFKLDNLNYFYVNNDNTLLFNLLIGLLLGFAYALFELPNSFIKRRIGIQPGKNPEGLKKVFFIFLDQADSVFGIMIVLWLFYDIGLIKYLLFVLIGAITHIIINMLLYLLKLRKNMF